MQAALIYETGL